MGFLLTPRAAAAAGIVLSAIVAGPLTAQAVIRGALYDDASGAPVRGTVMLVNPSDNAPVAHVVTDSLGRFELTMSGGTYQLAAVRDGYSSLLSAPIPIVSGERMTVRMPLAQEGSEPRHSIGVTEHVRPDASAQRAAEALSEGHGMVAFKSRRTVGAGLHFDRAALATGNATTLGEFLQNVPGLRVGDPSATSSIQMSRSPQPPTHGGLSAASCHVGWFIDGHRMDLPSGIDPITDGLGTMSLEVVEGIEIFRGVSEMPPEFAEPGLRCGAVAIWTRRG
jgi:carboxypeptidase family protein